MTEEVLRNTISAVLQNFSRYELTVNENIGFGHIEKMHDHSLIASVAGKSGADEFIEILPNKYDTTLGKAIHEGGTDLSTGQWQKLAIARSYLRDTDIVILDEPTASLDVKAEVEVYRQFQKLSKNKTSILISHRLGSARIADQIVVLHQGEIIEVGTHTELIEQNGHYAKMYAAQSEWYQQ
jgi:ATP-binding cassette subfamily B protein